MTGVPPTGSGHSPKGGAASSTASSAEPSVPNALTCFSVGLDRLAREVAGWPESVVVHTMEVLNGGDGEKDPQVLLEGHTPTGEKNGHATFAGCSRHLSFKAVVRLSEYRAAIATEAGTAATPQSGVVHEGADPQGIAQGGSHDL